MIYLDHGATSFPKPRAVAEAVNRALWLCANPGRGGHKPAMAAAQAVYDCREKAALLFDCQPEQIVFTANCTQGLNMAIRTLVKPGARVVVSGFEHNAVTRPLYALGAQVRVAGRRLFDWEHTLEDFEDALRQGAEAAVFTHISNVFGYIHPVAQLAGLCHQYGVPFVLDAAQSAGTEEISLEQLGAAFIAMPGHKGLLGPQGTGILLCGDIPKPLIYGGTGSNAKLPGMPEELPDRAEAGTLNVPGIAGLSAGLSYLLETGTGKIQKREQRQAQRCTEGLKRLGVRVFSGTHQGGTLSFVPEMDCEDLAQGLTDFGIGVRSGLHCAPLAHQSAGTLDTGTVRVSFGYNATDAQTDRFLQAVQTVIKA